MCQRKKLRKTLPVAKLRGMSDEVASPKISVVVPVYKVEKYLRDCVESVLAQSFGDFELILVDDGSPDRSGEICEELAKKDSRIRVFHQENGGVTSARRHGVEQAHGEWINFVDADDLLPPNALKDLIDEADGDTDWVRGMSLLFRDGDSLEQGWIYKQHTRKIYDLDELAEDTLRCNGSLCSKIVRKKLFSPEVLDIPRDIKTGEDVLANLRLVANGPRNPKDICATVSCVRRFNQGSATNTYVASENYILRYAELLFAEAEKFPEGSRKRIEEAMHGFLSSFIKSLVNHGGPVRFHRQELLSLIRPCARKSLKCFFVYLCLRFNYLWLAHIVARIFFFLKGRKFDATGKTLLE